MYGLTTKTAATENPVTVEDAKTHLRVEYDEDDEYIESLITAATPIAESYLQRALVTQTLTLTLDAFPPDVIFVPNLSYHDYDPAVRLPRNPVQSVDEIRYIDDGGTEQTLGSSKYRAELNQEPARITAAYGETWPITRPITGAVNIDFTCGYGTASAVPVPIKHAIKILVATWYDPARAAVAMNASIANIPMTAEYLLGPYRVATHSGAYSFEYAY